MDVSGSRRIHCFHEYRKSANFLRSWAIRAWGLIANLTTDVTGDLKPEPEPPAPRLLWLERSGGNEAVHGTGMIGTEQLSVSTMPLGSGLLLRAAVEEPALPAVLDHHYGQRRVGKSDRVLPFQLGRATFRILHSTITTLDSLLLHSLCSLATRQELKLTSSLDWAFTAKYQPSRAERTPQACLPLELQTVYPVVERVETKKAAC
ncbi:hypothetical protein MKZ38_002336 [Zalerion maritima]|uniref:Uncharacterized protein n=1 Tax=Zalerion maritima TaxID=339359 RepID=A0AAD5S572_9PEZI|nr:hypothetical protein MKZ38_002336 [Zalerion maritima]